MNRWSGPAGGGSRATTAEQARDPPRRSFVPPEDVRSVPWRSNSKSGASAASTHDSLLGRPGPSPTTSVRASGPFNAGQPSVRLLVAFEQFQSVVSRQVVDLGRRTAPSTISSVLPDSIRPMTTANTEAKLAEEIRLLRVEIVELRETIARQNPQPTPAETPEERQRHEIACARDLVRNWWGVEDVDLEEAIHLTYPNNAEARNEALEELRHLERRNATP